MTTLFISHSSQDDGFVRELRAALADQGQEVWIDSRQLRGGDPLWLEIQRAIEAASAFAVIVSPAALQSKWVGDELAHALKVQKCRGHVVVHTDELGPLLRDHRIPLVFLDACQTAQAEAASESVASELLKVGVASVVAMSHSVLVETSRRFVEAFYAGLAVGRRVGDAMLAGQRGLKDDSFRGRIFGAGSLRLQDWFVPVLFQEQADPQLFRAIPSAQTVADSQAMLTARLAALPPPPETGFVGRSRELLALQRLLLPSPLAAAGGEGPGVRGARYAVIRGQGGEGKTALAAELGRWLVRSQQMRAPRSFRSRRTATPRPCSTRWAASSWGAITPSPHSTAWSGRSCGSSAACGSSRAC